MNTGSSSDPRDTFPTLKDSAKEREGVKMMVSENTRNKAVMSLLERNVIGTEVRAMAWHGAI